MYKVLIILLMMLAIMACCSSGFSWKMIGKREALTVTRSTGSRANANDYVTVVQFSIHSMVKDIEPYVVPHESICINGVWYDVENAYHCVVDG